MTVLVLGRFPPPIDGHTIATQRLSDLLAPSCEVHRVDLSAKEVGLTQARVRLRPGKVRHYVGLRWRTQVACQTAPRATVLWTSVSPSPLGHLRDVLTVLPAFRPEQRVYAVVHWGNFERLFTSFSTRWTARRLVERVAGFVFLSEQLSQRCAPWIPADKRHVIPNTLGADVLCTPKEVVAKQQRRASRKVLRVLFLSNMISEKGYLDVLTAVGIMRQRGLPVEAHFAGGWTSEVDRLAFERQVAADGLQGAVTHYGAVRDRARVKRLYLDADIFVLPTSYPTEAQPLSIIEALNAGTPVVTTAHAGIPEMVRQGQEALFVPPHDPVRIAEAVQELADVRQWLDFSRGARQRFEAAFSPEVVRQRWEALLEKTVSNAG
ncbi:MAG: glycosyltransferase family 4 protein [Rhodothermales bacterium]